jgi:DNA topoisomerase-1
MSTLVIVESPAKAKTLQRILGNEYRVEASYGHIRDLPETARQVPARLKGEKWARLGVDIESDFEPLYVVSDDKKRHIKRLEESLKNADSLLLATDEDREGESISWHVVELLKPTVPVRRIVFHEITDEAILAALDQPREIDMNLVKAQESRRILDRLFGYQVSPVLWKKVSTGLSAGRVQSVAVRLCVMRERERRRFRVSRYWDAEADFVRDGLEFSARLARIGDRRIAAGKDFDSDTGDLKVTNDRDILWLRSEEDINSEIDSWTVPWTVTSIDTRPLTRRPAPPFITATLQQEANRKLGFSARHTMRVAQRLYEGVDVNGDRVGLITYMRTDSVTLSNKALRDAERVIGERYGKEYTSGARRYATKSKAAQEAHEAIRPTELSRLPEDVEHLLQADEYRLYELVWKRTIASQMTDARMLSTSVEFSAPGAEGRNGLFTATGKAIEFPGFLRAYVEGSDDPSAEIADKEVLLPSLAVGDELTPRTVTAKSHETTPPPRYNEASLVRKLESEGIGRPSTYASILDTIQNRGYVVKHGKALVPTFTAFAVTKLLEGPFADYVDTQFTARMEQKLDDIAEGDLDWKEHLRAFYFGNGDDRRGLQGRIDDAGENLEYPSITVGDHPENGRPIIVRIGRYGPYLQYEDAEGERHMASVPDLLPPADLTPEYAVEILRKAARGAVQIGYCPDTDQPVYLAHGRFGAYVQLGETPKRGSGESKPKRSSIPRGVSEDDVNLELALKWLSLPRTLGVHPDSEEEVVAASGRFGPYIKSGNETRSLTSDDDVYEIGLERALELLAQPKKSRRKTSQRKVLKELGDDGDGGKVQILEGPYGAYLTNGKLNASLPKETAPESVDLVQANSILAERGKPPRRGRRRSRKKS